MKCEYSDGMKIDYSGSLRIRKGDEVNVFIKDEFIPADVKGFLAKAESERSCDEMRRVATIVTDTVGTRVCIHE